MEILIAHEQRRALVRAIAPEHRFINISSSDILILDIDNKPVLVFKVKA